MDPLSVSASLFGLLELTNGTLLAINELSRDLRHGPTDIASLAHNLQSLMGILNSVVHDNTRTIADSGRKHSPSFQAFYAIGA